MPTLAIFQLYRGVITSTKSSNAHNQSDKDKIPMRVNGTLQKHSHPNHKPNTTDMVFVYLPN